MAIQVPLPRSVRDLVRQNTHPGLALDKYVPSWDPTAETGKLSERVQKPAVENVVRLSQRPPEGLDYAALCQRWQQTLAGRVVCFQAKTVGPLTLHLARASALENAGICMHPIYGFAYMPGTGLKGLARAFAETVWLPTQLGADWASAPAQQWNEALDKIDQVFGYTPYIEPPKEAKQQMSDLARQLDRRRKERNKNAPKEAKAHVGQIIFYDAWPVRWPSLIVDILNNHHPSYYRDQEPPGDWDSPVPVYFLAVPAGQSFLFAVGKRRQDVADELLELASQWLIGALQHEGAGAKTNAGYGQFQLEQAPEPIRKAQTQGEQTWQTACNQKRRTEFTCTLELITPAFLAGAYQFGSQGQKDCQLRPATLRGLLRWWWRTMHAGHVDAPTLARLEAAVWGDTHAAGAVQISLRPHLAHLPKVIPAPGKRIQKDKKGREVLRADPEVLGSLKLIPPPNEKTTQGILYFSYGMDEMPAGRPNERKRRFVMLPGAKWHLVLTARDGIYRPPDSDNPVHVPASLLLEQAKAALWLLCHFGGIGSKSRKGFGSLSDLEGYFLEGSSGDILDKVQKVAKVAEEFRKHCKVPQNDLGCPTSPSLLNSESKSFHICIGPISTPWKNVWFVLDQLGYCIQQFAQSENKKRNWRKEALGLPRKIGLSDQDGRKDRGYKSELDDKTKQEVVWLGQHHPYRGDREPKNMRHASPIHFHIARRNDGTYEIRALAFLSNELPDLETSQRILEELKAHVESDMQMRIKKYPNIPPPSSQPTSPNATTISTKRSAGTQVYVKILETRPKGGYNVQEEGKPPGTLTVGAAPSPPPNIGDIVQVEILDDDPKHPQYRWPKAPSAEPKKPNKPPRSR